MNTPASNARPRRKSDPLPTPWWAWAFVVACAAIPVLTLGGALPGAVGFGGAGACYAVARHPDMSPPARAGVCLAVTLACYCLVVTVFGGIAYFSR